jgi:ABC-type dipeptide/oligopeptide/nickel transport system ATPase component
MADTLLEVRDLRTYIYTRRGVVKAVDGVSFSLRRGEVLGLVGESGCGKSLTALSLMRLLPKGGARTIKGQVLLGGENILERTPAEMREIRGRRISMVLQDPQTSLNPVFSIGDQLREAILRRKRGTRAEVMKEAVAALRRPATVSSKRASGLGRRKSEVGGPVFAFSPASGLASHFASPEMAGGSRGPLFWIHSSDI